MVFQTIRMLCGKRIPAIRFRKGAPHAAGANSGTYAASASSNSSTQQSSAIEDWELPDRYRRKPIGEYECEYINRGGPE